MEGTRDNGLRCASYVAVTDVDPRIADALLRELRDSGIAAYAAPTPAASGGYMELRLPERPLDRVWVDESLAERARAIVARETDFDTAWQQVLTSLQSTPGPPMPTWPASSEPADDASAARGSEAVSEDADDDELAGFDPADEAHFEPPPPPPLPRFRPVTLGALVLIALGMLVVVTHFDGGNLDVLGYIAVFGGFASLVWNMRQGPPTDSGWDDGAVV
ncbi:MAG: hypothetical protein JO222_01720 [Frankiales bacterium]|nr:hypothetical protein [Frankiales bacterium]